MTDWYCHTCPVTGTDCGPWEDNSDIFKQIKSFHRGHLGFQIGEPNIEGLTEVEQTFTDFFNQNIHKWFHGLMYDQKGPTKTCLRRSVINEI
ncbi:MAG TPA: hypothetical protein VMW74_06355 [Nitrosopumilaceae archaeon]|nr:hypothetical protein [Nitrosopumilaceae archaeon]